MRYFDYSVMCTYSWPSRYGKIVGMEMRSIRIGRHTYQVEVASAVPDILIGMIKYNQAPRHGMLIYAKYPYLVMEGMKFSLDVIFLDRAMRVIGTRRAYPSDGPFLLPHGTAYILEFPVGMLKNDT